MCVKLVKNGVVSVCPTGFSWTMFFFGFFVPLLRGDIVWFFLNLLISCITFGASNFVLCFFYNTVIVCPFLNLLISCITSGVGNFVLCFFYNRIYIRSLLLDGYLPADEFSKQYFASKDLLRQA